MNRLATRYFGFYRPWGFKENKFMFFYTENPKRYGSVIQKHMSKLSNEGFFEIAYDIFGLRCAPSYLTFTKNSYPNYKDIHHNVSKFLLQKESDTMTFTKSKIKHWPVVSLEEKEMMKLDNPDNFIEEILTKNCVNEFKKLVDTKKK
ncbi:putative orfan [Tupanvirus soda lake]|uniref:Orfan n=2 Tax=Tupanvirus TaxID=2094720 RepID=A0AC62AB44_9VIRU|nr:putative orfan [Tupanvirus soda lake]QKU34949.1 putative orfan [Tupanvirus soda lake]